MNFALEEINLMCIYDTSDRNRLRHDISASLKDVYDLEMRDLMLGVMAKLKDLTDEEFSQVGFYPEYELEEQED